MSHAGRRKAAEEFRMEKRGFICIVDPGPCLALLREIGIDAVGLHNARGRQTNGDSPEGNVHSGIEMGQRKRGEDDVPRDTG
eukprot:105399-Pyramimonas_sp.AAC.1